MSFGDVTTRSDAGALIPEEVSREIWTGVMEESAVMRLARKMPNASRNQVRMPVSSELVQAYFVSGDTGTKQTTKKKWVNKFINIGEIAAIFPVPENVLNDLDYDLWGQVRPDMIRAIGKTFDKAVLYGTNKPSDWPDGIVTQAVSAGHLITAASATGVDLYDDLFAEGGLLNFMEVDGFDPNAFLGHQSMKARLRSARDAQGQPIFFQGMLATGPSYNVLGQEIVFPKNGSIDSAQSLLVAGDWQQLVWTIRTDLNWKIADQAVLTDEFGDITHNLFQQDMIALRVTFRCGWQVPNPVNDLAPTEATRWPFAVYRQS